MKSVLFWTAFLGVFLVHLAPSEALKCYKCVPSDIGCGDTPLDTSKHTDWLKTCNSGNTCLKTFDSSNSVTRACNNHATCVDGALTSYSSTCFNGVCTEEYCCTGEGCNSAPLATSVGSLLTASMVLTTWVLTK